MNILYLLVPLALGLGVSALAGFIACARRGQFDDLETPAYRALIDDSERKLK
ncbi:MAG: cbb3-type cytochrome oxidase assembly protein CcoS [Bdellovibrionota bacterium]